MITAHRRSPFRLLVRVAAATAAVTLSAGTAPAVAADDGSIGIRLLEAPEDRRDDPRAQVYIVDHLAPGTTITRKVEVTNSGTTPMDVSLYAGPSDIVGGVWTPAAEGESSDLTSWTTVGSGAAQVPPGGAVQVPVTIAVPAAASEGERYGVVWAQTSAGGDGNVTLVSRVGIRIYLSVGPGGEPASSFEITTLTAGRADDGSHEVVAAVRNTGGRALDIEGELKLTDGPDGLSAGPYPTSERISLEPGDEGRIPVRLEGTLPDGPWVAVVTLRSGELSQKARATLTFPEKGEASPVTAEPDEGRPMWWYAAPIALAAVVGSLSWLVLRPRRRLVA